WPSTGTAPCRRLKKTRRRLPGVRRPRTGGNHRMLKYEVGQSVPRTEDPRLLKGRGKYVDDFNMPYQAHAVMVRSPHAHAEIKGIDASAALAMPGVLAVLTGADYAADGLGPVTGPTPHKRRDGSAMYRPPRPAITGDRVRHVGQIV